MSFTHIARSVIRNHNLIQPCIDLFVMITVQVQEMKLNGLVCVVGYGDVTLRGFYSGVLLARRRYPEIGM